METLGNAATMLRLRARTKTALILMEVVRALLMPKSSAAIAQNDDQAGTADPCPRDFEL